MREIKFRQAIYIKDKFHHWHYWGFLPNLSFAGPDSINGLAHALDNSQQYTGLKGKNGKEIYEGDTLKNPKDPRGNNLFDVAWSEMFHGWIGNSQTECLQMKPCMFNESEIIGNVHQMEKPK